MKRDEQLKVNEFCDVVMGAVYDALRNRVDWQPFRSCQASTITLNGSITVLKFYNTVVAVVVENPKRGNVGIDYLRYAYGYTATSAQHIAKFFNDYGVSHRYTWREV